MDNLHQQWKQARHEVELPVASVQDIIAKANNQKKNVLYSHYGNIAIMTFTLIVISLFFYYRMSYQKWTSVVGAILMVGGLALRIIIEVMSSFQSKRIQLLQDVSCTTEAAIAFYNFRKKIHGPVTISIVALYMIGFYLLTPEFSNYFSFDLLLLMDVSFFIGAFILIWVIRKGIKQEMEQLLSLTGLKEQLAES
jgi:VanZ family protein